MLIEIISPTPCNVTDYCPYKESCGKPVTHLIAMARDGVWNGSAPFGVCDEHLSEYLEGGLFAELKPEQYRVLNHSRSGFKDS